MGWNLLEPESQNRSKNQTLYYSTERFSYNVHKTWNMPIIEGFDDDAILSVDYSQGSIVVTKHAIPGVGYQMHFRDPEGNVIGIMENDPSAY
jgi:hypothetical protein